MRLSLQLFPEKNQIYQAAFPKVGMKIWELDKKGNTYIVLLGGENRSALVHVENRES